MADRKAVNKYYPPEWDPTKGSINTFRGSHPLRERARKLDQGIMIIRFELPYNIWCGGCGSHVGMGVRYNAEKTTVGKYYSTPIFKFRMKCHLCDSHFEIQTDPKNMDYVVVSGASRKNERWEHVEGETVSVEGKSEVEKLSTDPMYWLEHGIQDKKKAEEAAPDINKIMEMKQQDFDDAAVNAMARKKFRATKHVLKKKADADSALKQRAAISIDLVDEHHDDIEHAQKVTFRPTLSRSPSHHQQLKRLEITAQPVLATPTSRKTAPTPKQATAKRKESLLAVCSGKGASVSSSGASVSSSGAPVRVTTKELRTTLGIKTRNK